MPTEAKSLSAAAAPSPQPHLVLCFCPTTSSVRPDLPCSPHDGSGWRHVSHHQHAGAEEQINVRLTFPEA